MLRNLGLMVIEGVYFAGAVGVLFLVAPEPRQANPAVLMVLILVLLGLVPASITAWIAAGKGRGACGWFVAGFFFNWLAWLIAIWIPPVQPVEVAGGVECPQCGGRGYIMDLGTRAAVREGSMDPGSELVPCPTCQGHGVVPEGP
ncbi:MAG: hypothetical protein PVH68_05010 [Armatimonadota bacterium]